MFYILLCSTAVATLRQGISLIFNRVLSAEDLPTKKLYGGTSSWASSFGSVAGEVSHNISASKWVCILRTAFRAAFLQEHLSWLRGTKILNIVTWNVMRSQLILISMNYVFGALVDASGRAELYGTTDRSIDPDRLVCRSRITIDWSVRASKMDMYLFIRI